MYYDIIIIGGGAGGMSTAIKSKTDNNSVLLIEHGNRVGKKILSTGNGKCNLTNSFCKVDLFSSNPEGIYPYYPRENRKFIEEIIGRFDSADTLNWFRSLGILCIDKNGYCYPMSEQASSVLDTLRFAVRTAGVETVTDYQPLKIRKKKGRFLIDNIYECSRLVLAAGGMAAEKTGSDGSGYDIAASFGHHIRKPLPALCGLTCAGEQFKILKGVRADCTLKMYDASPKQPLAEIAGNVQFNSYGLSGIPVMQLSSYAARLLSPAYPEYQLAPRIHSRSSNKEKKNKLYIDVAFLPQLEFDELAYYIAEKLRHTDRQTRSLLPVEWILTGLLNAKVITVILKEIGLKPGMALSDALDTFRMSGEYANGKVCGKKLDHTDDALIFAARIAGVIKHFTVEVTGTCGFSEAQVTLGGVSTEEIDPSTMESRLVPGLYFVGEILDVDGICGGYNLQWAWSTAAITAAALRI